LYCRSAAFGEPWPGRNDIDVAGRIDRDRARGAAAEEMRREVRSARLTSGIPAPWCRTRAGGAIGMVGPPHAPEAPEKARW
jgi:hypothetical protein